MAVEDSDLAVTYSLIYSFLTERSHFKAAEAVKKAAKGTTIMKSGSKDRPSLPVIVKQWKKFVADQEKKSMSSTRLTRSESSGSDTDSDSSEMSGSIPEKTSSGSDTHSGTNSRPLIRSKAQVIPFKKSSSPAKVGAGSKAKSLASESSSSSELDGESDASSDSESNESSDDKVTSGPKLEGTKTGETTVVVSPKSESEDSPSSGSNSSESSSNEESDSEYEEDGLIPKAGAMGVNGANASSVPESHSPTRSSQTLPSIKSSDDSDSDSESSGSSTSVDSSSPSSGSDSDPGSAPGSGDTSGIGKKSVQKNVKPQNMKVANAPDTPAIRFPQETDRPIAVTKRRRTDEAGSSIPASIIRQPKAFNPHRKGNGKGQAPKTNTPFSRIKVDEVKFTDERLKDNSFESRKAAANDYGAKASADLVVTRGASFRKEKNKKKRGSYRGGDITMETHSIKFTD